MLLLRKVMFNGDLLPESGKRGKWIGVAWEASELRTMNDGTLHGHRYFHVPAGCTGGTFIRPAMLTVMSRGGSKGLGGRGGGGGGGASASGGGASASGGGASAGGGAGSSSSGAADTKRGGDVLVIGDEVRAYYRGHNAAKYPGVIKKINANGSYVINFDDGDVDKSVKMEHIWMKGAGISVAATAARRKRESGASAAAPVGATSASKRKAPAGSANAVGTARPLSSNPAAAKKRKAVVKQSSGSGAGGAGAGMGAAIGKQSSVAATGAVGADDDDDGEAAGGGAAAAAAAAAAHDVTTNGTGSSSRRRFLHPAVEKIDGWRENVDDHGYGFEEFRTHWTAKSGNHQKEWRTKTELQNDYEKGTGKDVMDMIWSVLQTDEVDESD